MKVTRGISVLAALVGFAQLAASPTTAHAAISIRAGTSGAAVHWNQGSQLTFRVNTTNSSGMAAGDIFSIFTTALSRWKQAAFDGFSFLYYQGTDTSRYPNFRGSAYDNTIFFTSNGASSERLQCGVIALTEVWFDPSTGTASKADLRFNDNCYVFTTNPADTVSQYRIYLGDVAQHELGHALGLDHSQNLQSTMIYTAAIEMSAPACDDQAAMVSLYGGSARARAGFVTGQVVTPGGSPVFGAHVTAVSLERGTALASALTEKDGTFSIAGVEQGTYSVVVEPYYPGASTLGPYYASVSSAVCGGGAAFERTFQTDGAGRLRAHFVTAGGATSAGTITVSCAAPASINGNSETSFNSAPTLAAANLSSPVATQGTFTNSSTDHYYRLANQSGHLELHALSYSLFSRADVSIEVLNAYGTRLTQSSTGNVFYNTSSNYVNYDAMTAVDLASPQDVIVHVYTRTTLATGSFPSSSVGVSSTRYYVVTASRGTSGGLQIYPNNARCENADTFTAYASQGEAPEFRASSEDDSKGGFGCGTIDGGDHDPTSGGGLLRLVNFATLVAMLLVARRALRGTPAGQMLPG